ncbi:MAG: N-acetylmuramoyl-L-alanine amidase [Deltaproteobacteria bacterium]|nr:N-acetylmuramoyl-L-alanine amidase [Deltaproteobacteria bacterium]
MGVTEKHVNLSIAFCASGWLSKQGVEVVMTRKNDVDVSLQQRCDIANKSGASCFVSIHANASENPEANGLEVYYYEGSKEGLRLANLLNMQLFLATNTPSGKIIAVKEADIPVTAGEATELQNRGVKEAHFYVLRHTAMPAALVEVAFLSNPIEEAWLTNAGNQELVGKVIAKAICQYLGVNFVDKVNPEQVIDWLVSRGIISNPDYWRGALRYIKNLDALLVKLYTAFKNLT